MRRKKCNLSVSFVLFSLVFVLGEIEGEEKSKPFIEWAKAGDGDDGESQSSLLSSKNPGNFVGKRELTRLPPSPASTTTTKDAEGDVKVSQIEQANPHENELIPDPFSTDLDTKEDESKLDFIEAQNGPTLDPNPQSKLEPGQNKPQTMMDEIVLLSLGKDESDQENDQEANSAAKMLQVSDSDPMPNASVIEKEEESVTMIDVTEQETTTTTTVAPPKVPAEDSGEALLTWRRNPLKKKSHSHNAHANSGAVNRARIRNRMRDIYRSYFTKKQREQRSHNSKNEDRCAHIRCKPPPEDADCEMERTNIQIPIFFKFHTLQSCCPLFFCTSKTDGTFYTHYGMYSTKKVAHLSRRHKLNSHNHIHVPKLEQNVASTDGAVVDTSSSAVPISLVPVAEEVQKVAPPPETDSDKHFEAKASTYYKYTEKTNSDGQKDAKLAGQSSRSLSGGGHNPHNPIPIQVPVQNVAATSVQSPSSHPVPVPAPVEAISPIQSQFSFTLNTPQIQDPHLNHQHQHRQNQNPSPSPTAFGSPFAFTPITFPQFPQFPFSNFGSFGQADSQTQNQNQNQNQNSDGNLSTAKISTSDNPFAIFDDPNFPFVNPFRSAQKRSANPQQIQAQGQGQVQISSSSGNGNFAIQVQN